MGVRGQRGQRAQKAKRPVRPRTTATVQAPEAKHAVALTHPKVKTHPTVAAVHRKIVRERHQLISPKFKGVKTKKHRKPRLLGQIRHRRHPFVNPKAHRGFKFD